MRRVTSVLLLASAAIAGGMALYVSQAPAGFSSSPFGSPGAGASSGSGTLARADKDLYADTFVASGISQDGGVAAYSYISNTDAKMKIGAGTQMELVPNGNSLTVNVGALHVPTTFISQPACETAQTCRWYADPGYWFGVSPSADVTGCGANAEGGIKANSSTHRLTYCDGTNPVPVTVEAVGGVQLPTYATADLPAASPAGRLVYDTDAACVKATNGSAWSCL